jgi:branched-subunit amino acid transport protein AzlD
MSQSTIVAIAALFVTSCLVRILPAFVSFRLGLQSQRYLERVLPAAVFINFATYIVYTEATREPVAALVSLTAVVVVAWLNIGGLISTAGIGAAIYFVLASGAG